MQGGANDSVLSSYASGVGRRLTGLFGRPALKRGRIFFVHPNKLDQVQMVEVLNGLTAREALCLFVGCMLTVLDEAPSDEERQRPLDGCIDPLKRVPVGLKD
jgi:hypothetical protein